MKTLGTQRKHNLSTASSIMVPSLCYTLACSDAFSFDEEADEIKKNVGELDRLLRIIGGVILIAMSFKTRYTWVILGIFGLYGIVTGLAGFCPISAILGINTAEKDRSMKIQPKRSQINAHLHLLKKGGEI